MKWFRVSVYMATNHRRAKVHTQQAGNQMGMPNSNRALDGVTGFAGSTQRPAGTADTPWKRKKAEVG